MIDTHEKLKDEILLRLGSPVVTIEITEDQVYSCIDRALELYNEYHSDGDSKVFFTHNLTEEEKTTGEIVFDFPILSIVDLYGLKSNLYETAAFLVGGNYYGGNHGQYHHPFMNLSGVGSLSTRQGGNLISWTIWVMYKDMVTDMLLPKPSYNYNQDLSKLSVFSDLSEMDTPLGIGAYIPTSQAISAGVNPGGVYNNRWVKDFSTALSKQQWAQNLMKFEQIPLPGGASMNVTAIKNDAENEIDKLRTELLDIMEPDLFFLG